MSGPTGRTEIRCCPRNVPTCRGHFPRQSPAVQYWVQKALGEVYYSQGDLERSTTAAEKAAEAASEAGEVPESANAYLQSSDLYEILGDWEDAAKNAEKALGIFKGIGNTNGQAIAATDLVEIYGDRNSSIRDLAKATEYYSTAKQLTPENKIADIDFYLRQTDRIFRRDNRQSSGYQNMRCRRNSCRMSGWLAY